MELRHGRRKLERDKGRALVFETLPDTSGGRLPSNATRPDTGSA